MVISGDAVPLWYRNAQGLRTILVIITVDKVTEIFCIADDFRKFLFTITIPNDYHNALRNFCRRQ